MLRLLQPLLLLPFVAASPISVPRDIIPGTWIVQLKDDSTTDVLSSTVRQVSSLLNSSPRHTYDFGTFKGFAIDSASEVESLLSSIASIASIEPDSIVRTNALTTQSNPPYGLARISHRSPGASEYVYDDSAGQGTYAYIIDTGIYLEHNDFDGRAVFGANFAGDGNNTDGNGHGTHVAGTTGSTTYGVAKKTTLVAVKVLGADGSGTNSGVLAGIDWAVKDAKAKGRIGKAVANLSLGGILSPMTNAAVTEAVNQGLFLAVAAGNSGLPTFTSSPASASAVCTIGATDAQDNRASFSNFGFLVDVFAPGVNVTSAWIDGPDDTNTISGTSMATPHVTGLGAYLLALEGPRTPDALCQRIIDLSTKDAIKTDVGLLFSRNRLAFNGATA